MMMIERVSRAIQDAIPGWLADDGKVEDIDLARAALTALLEPSEAMVSVATMFDIENGRGGWVNMTESEFYEFNGQLIRAALDQKP